MRSLLVSLCLMLTSLFAAAQSQSQLNIMPMPASFQLGSGKLVISQSFSVVLTGYKEDRLDHAVKNFVRDLARQTGMPLNAKPGDASTATLVIHTEHAAREVQELGEDESYTLNVTAANAQLTAPTPLGAMRSEERRVGKECRSRWS